MLLGKGGEEESKRRGLPIVSLLISAVSPVLQGRVVVRERECCC